jgi:hypothetical protein
MPRGDPKRGRAPRMAKPAAPEPDVPAADVMSGGDRRPGNVTDGSFLKHLRLCSDAKTALDETNGVYRAKLKAAKTDGIDTSALISVMRARKKEPADVAEAMQKRIRYLTLAGIPLGTQFALFGTPELTGAEAGEQAEWDADDAGYQAGRTGGAQTDNPHQAGRAAFAAWVRGFKRGLTAIARQLGKNARVASTRRGRSGKAKPDEPATLQ